MNYSYDDDIREGVITEVSSDMDSYEDMQLKDGVALYWSKKMKKFTPVKAKNENTVFLTVVTGKGLQEQTDYISMNEVL